jgi:hypothetical protein
LCTFESELDIIWIRTRSNKEVVFKLPLIAFVKKVDSRVDVPILDLLVVGNIGAPLSWIIPDEIVALPVQFIQAYDLCMRVRACESHPNGGF